MQVQAQKYDTPKDPGWAYAFYVNQMSLKQLHTRLADHPLIRPQEVKIQRHTADVECAELWYVLEAIRQYLYAISTNAVVYKYDRFE